jgi:hypothetical protein
VTGVLRQTKASRPNRQNNPPEIGHQSKCLSAKKMPKQAAMKGPANGIRDRNRDLINNIK